VTARDPFAALGLRPSPGLTDDDIRAAWRRIAAATHPDRADGGDPAAYRDAAAAYAILRAAWGRSEAYADLRVGMPARDLPPPRAAPSHPRLSPWRAVVLVPSRIRYGRPGRLLLRILAAALLSLIVLHSGAGTPPIAALITGICTWLALTSRGDLAPPPAGNSDARHRQARTRAAACPRRRNCPLPCGHVKGAPGGASLRDRCATLDLPALSQNPAPIGSRQQSGPCRKGTSQPAARAASRNGHRDASQWHRCAIDQAAASSKPAGHDHGQRKGKAWNPDQKANTTIANNAPVIR
jgi:hypothetical protein